MHSLYNVQTNTLIEDLDYIDPETYEKVAGPAEQEYHTRHTMIRGI